MTPEEQREQMVREQLQGRGLTDPRLLRVFRKMPRHLFVPPECQQAAYTDHPLPIGAKQTISQPYMTALMTNCLRLQGHERVLEIGTGSGYQTAILAELALEVYSIERLQELLSKAVVRMEALGYTNVHLSVANGSPGWPEHAPYDAILVTAAAPEIPEPLLTQLADGGRLVLPIGPPQAQMLIEVEKRHGTLHRREVTSCVFVPLVGKHGWPDHTV